MSGVAKVTASQRDRRMLMGKAEVDARADGPEVQPDQTKPWEPCVFRPLPKAEKVPLSRQQCAGGDETHDRLRQLIAGALREPPTGEWTAADYNNLGCAYVWLYGRDGKTQADKWFKRAKSKAKADPQPSEQSKAVIDANIKLLGTDSPDAD